MQLSSVTTFNHLTWFWLTFSCFQKSTPDCGRWRLTLRRHLENGHSLLAVPKPGPRLLTHQLCPAGVCGLEIEETAVSFWLTPLYYSLTTRLKVAHPERGKGRYSWVQGLNSWSLLLVGMIHSFPLNFPSVVFLESPYQGAQLLALFHQRTSESTLFLSYFCILLISTFLPRLGFVWFCAWIKCNTQSGYCIHCLKS